MSPSNPLTSLVSPSASPSSPRSPPPSFALLVRFYLTHTPSQHLIVFLTSSAVVGLLWSIIGYVAALSGLAVILILMVPYPVFAGFRIEKQREDVSQVSDKRLTLVNEVLSSIKAVKLYSWENHFINWVPAFRRRGLMIMLMIPLV